MYKKLNFFKTKEPDDVWRLPPGIMQSFNLIEGDLVILYCGSASVRVTVRCLKKPDLPQNLCGLSTGVLKKMNIPKNLCFQVKPIGNKQFRLGPLIGILTFPGHLPDRLPYYAMYDKRNNDNGLLIVFRGQDINPTNNTVKGYYFDRVKNQWVYRILPYPDAVIDRVYPNAYKSHAHLEEVIGPNKIFNKRSMIDKVQFYKALKPDPLLSQYLPETRVLQNISDIKYFFQKYKEIFFKPVNAMKGIGIVVAQKKSNGFKCLYTICGQNYTEVVPSVAEIPAVLVKAADYTRPYIIQQSIPRLKYQDGPLSFRTWAMKDGTGQWVMPGMFAKSAQGDGFLTNFMAGAKLVPLKDLFKTLLPQLLYTKKEFMNLLEYLTIRTAVRLDKAFGPLGEIGLDIVFDSSSKPWLIEANGNPGNIPIFKQTDYPAWPHLIFQYPLDYATFLAGFK